MKKRKSKRDGVKYPGLTKNVNSKVRQEYIDQDYIDDLNEKEKRFLSNFNEEYYGGKFDHPGKILHKTKEERRECYGRNNARNRCLQSISGAGGRLDDFNSPVIEEIIEQETTTNEKFWETLMIDKINQEKILASDDVRAWYRLLIETEDEDITEQLLEKLTSYFDLGKPEEER